jgi:ParB family chromosome partitioning protein
MAAFLHNRKAVQHPTPQQTLSVIDLSIDNVRLNPQQPRRLFDQAKLDELSESIRQNGIIEPVIVRPTTDGAYELVAGERRFRAAVQAGLRSIPAVARTLDDRQTLEIAIIENVQREDINALECAQAYRRLIDEFGLTQEDVADRVGKKRSTIANTLRLLNLPVEILDSLDKGDISEGHARALLSVEDQRIQFRIWERVVAAGLNVRETEKLTRNPGACKVALTPNVARATKRSGRHDPNLSDVEDKLRRFLGTKVSIARQGEKGKLEIEFYDDEDLMRILDLIAQV